MTVPDGSGRAGICRTLADTAATLERLSDDPKLPARRRPAIVRQAHHLSQLAELAADADCTDACLRAELRTQAHVADQHVPADSHPRQLARHVSDVVVTLRRAAGRL